MDPNARSMRYKSWPYYEDWKIIFGKDRATGDTADDIYDAYVDLRDQDIGGDRDIGGGQGIRVDEGIDCDVEVDLEQLLENEEAAESVSHSYKTREVPNLKKK